MGYQPDSMKEVLQKAMQRAVGNSINILTLEPLSGGCINNAARVCTNRGDFFAKWNADAPADLFEKEAIGLSTLKSCETSLTIPEVLAYSKANDETPGYLFTEFLEEGYTKGQEEKLGAGLAELHSQIQEQYGFEVDTYCGATLQKNHRESEWTTFFVENRLLLLIGKCRASRGFSAKEEEKLGKFSANCAGYLNHSPHPALVHGDLWSGNYLFTTSGPALIDPAVSYADREFEFGIIRMFGGFSKRFWEAYQERLPFEYGWEKRNEIYQTYHYLNHYLLFGGGYKQSLFAIINTFA